MRSSDTVRKIPANSISLAGEFAVLSQLSLGGFDANMTLGRTKGVDILVSDPQTNRMYQLEVKTTRDNRKRPQNSKLFGRFVTDWIMEKKHESLSRPELWYCFVAITEKARSMRFYVVPSAVVARYVRGQHQYWLKATPNGKDTAMRLFRIGMRGEKYPIPTPTAEKYENNWGFKR